MKTEVVERVPQWAVCYLVNSDDSALSFEDKRTVDRYVARLLERDGLRLVRPIEGTENSFCPCPAFGLACDTVNFYAERVAEPWNKREWKAEALRHAETIGVYEYAVNDRFMEYWSFFGKGEGWYFIRYDLGRGKEVFRGANIPWDDEARVPSFLKTAEGLTKYNYMEG